MWTMWKRRGLVDLALASQSEGPGSSPTYGANFLQQEIYPQKLHSTQV